MGLPSEILAPQVAPPWGVIGSPSIDPHAVYSLFNRYSAPTMRPPAKRCPLTPRRTAIVMTALHHAHFTPHRGVNGAASFRFYPRPAPTPMRAWSHKTTPIGREGGLGPTVAQGSHARVRVAVLVRLARFGRLI